MMNLQNKEIILKSLSQFFESYGRRVRMEDGLFSNKPVKKQLRYKKYNLIKLDNNIGSKSFLFFYLEFPKMTN